MTDKIDYNIDRHNAIELMEEYLSYVGYSKKESNYKGINGNVVEILNEEKNIRIFPFRMDKKDLDLIKWLLENQCETDNFSPIDKIKLLRARSIINKMDFLKK